MKGAARLGGGAAAAIAALAALAAGCVLADPRPDPWNGPGLGAQDADRSGIPGAAFTNGAETPPSALDMSGVAVSGGAAVTAPVSVLGFSSAPGPGGVEVENLADGGGRTLGFVEGTGSFTVEIDAAAGDILVLRYMIVDMGAVTPTVGDVFVVPFAAASPVAALDASNLTVSEPDAGGLVVLAAAAGAATPGSFVNVGNLSNAGNAQAIAGLDGSFSVTLVADSGDRLTVFSASNLDPTATTRAVALVVP
jgi:hypothetical protein